MLPLVDVLPGSLIGVRHAALLCLSRCTSPALDRQAQSADALRSLGDLTGLQRLHLHLHALWPDHFRCPAKFTKLESLFISVDMESTELSAGDMEAMSALTNLTSLDMFVSCVQPADAETDLLLSSMLGKLVMLKRLAFGNNFRAETSVMAALQGLADLTDLAVGTIQL